MPTPLQLSRARVRLFLDADVSNPPIDCRTNNKPFLYAKGNVQFEIGLGWKRALIDATKIASLVLELRPMTGNTVPLSSTAVAMTLQVEIENDMILDADWHSGDNQHALLVFTGGQGGQTDIPFGDYWMSWYGWTNDGPPRKIPFQPGPISVLSDGSGAPTSAPPPGVFYRQDFPSVVQIAAAGGPNYNGLGDQTTANWPLNTSFGIVAPDTAPGGSVDPVAQTWRIEATSAATNAGKVQRGSDYNGATNIRAFVRRG